MEDFSTIIYIVIAIVAFIFSAKGNKKKQAQKKANIPSNSNPMLENILKEQIPQEWIEKESNKSKKEEIDEMGISPSEEGSVTNPELEPILKYEKKKKQTENNTTEKRSKEKFDARQAIIYSTIMDRKKY